MINKWQAQYQFWSSFGLPVYDAASVPDGDDAPAFPYITYSGVNGNFNESSASSISVWTRGTSWTEADTISDQIQEALKNGGAVVPYDGGIVWITPGEPFSQNMGDPEDDLIRRKYIIVQLHFC